MKKELINNKTAILILCAMFLCLKSAGQVQLNINSISIDYDVTDTEQVFDMVLNIVFKSPRIKLDVTIENNSADTVRFNTNYSYLKGNITYSFKGENFITDNAGLMTSDHSIPVPANIPPDDSYRFYLSFVPLPGAEFTLDNYQQSFFQILPTLKVTIEQETPQPLILSSGPFFGKGISVTNRCENENLGGDFQ